MLHGKDFDFAGLEQKSEKMGLVEASHGKKKAAKCLHGALDSGKVERKRFAEFELLEMLIRQKKLERKMDILTEKLEKLFLPLNQAVRQLMGLNANQFIYHKRTALKTLREYMELKKNGKISDFFLHG